MDMPEVKSFNAELSGLYDNKPPISKAKMSAITKGAIKAIKFYKHVVHSVEKFIQKCKPEYKVPGLYVIDSIVRQSRHQFGQEKDVFAPRFAKNMQQTFANLFRCPPEDKRNIIRVLNLWQKNNVFTSQVIQPLLDMADPNHPLHQEIQQQQNNTANGSSLNLSHNTSDNKLSPEPSSQHSPRMSSPMDGNQFQDEPSGPPNMKFNRKLLNDFEYESEDEPMILDPPLPTSHSHTTHSTHTSHSHTHTNQQPPSNPTDAMASILTNPEIMRQLQSLQAQMSLMTGMQIPNLMPMMSDMQLQQNQNQPSLPFLSQDQQNDAKEDMANESDIEFVDAGPQVIEIPDANDSRSPSPKARRHHSRSKSPRRRGRRSRTRSRSRSPRRRRDRERDRDRDRERDKDREREKEKSSKEREADREKQKEREKRGLPPIKKENLSVCSTTLWVGHLSKLATPEELSDLFGGLGGVVSIDVVAPRGCAFVVMDTRRDAYKALTKLNKHKLHSKEITVAWAPGKGVKGREWKEQWEAELGVSYLPWASLHARWLLGELQLDALEDGGMVDEETLPPWLPPRIMPKSMMENMSLLGMPPGIISLPPGMPPPMRAQLPPDMAAAALASPVNITRMPPPGMAGGLPPGMPPGLPPGIRPPNMPGGVPGMPDGGMPPAGAMIRFPPGMPPQAMGQPGMVAGFLPGLLGVGGMGNMGMPSMGNMSNMPMFAPVMPQHAPPSLQLPQRPNEGNDDDAMDLDTEDMHQDDSNRDNSENRPSTLLPDQIQALLLKPPPKFNASEPPPGFNASELPPFQPTDEKQDDDRKNDRERDRRDRDRNERDRRGDRRDRDRDRRNDNRNERGNEQRNERGNEQRNERGNEQRNERGNERGNERVNDRRDRGNERDRDGGRDDRRDRERDRGRDRRDRERDRDRGAPRDNNGDRSREKSPRQAAAADTAEKSLQERLWEMANGKPAARSDDKPRDDYVDAREPTDTSERMRPTDNESEGGADGPAGPAPEAWGAPPRPQHLAPPFRPDMRMRGPPNDSRPGGPWMDGPPGPPGPFGPRFNGLGPFNRPPFERPPFDGMPPRFERPPFRMPFDMSRPPFDGPRSLFDGPRPPFDGMRPPFNGPRPAYDKPRPAYDGPRPAYDAPPFDQPGFEPEIFDRNRRFDDREPFDRSWERREWDDRRRPREERPRDRRRPHDDKRPAREQRSASRDDRPDRQRDQRSAPRDDKSAPRDDRNASKDNRPAPGDDRSAPKDDRNAPKHDGNAPRDDRNMPKDDRNAPKDDRPAPRDDKNVRERSASKDEKSTPQDDKAIRDERRRERQDRKSRWGAESAPRDEDEPAHEPDIPIVIPDEIKLKLQETIARFPQSESESHIAHKETQPVLPTEGAPPEFIPAQVPEAFRSPPQDEAKGASENERELPQTSPQESFEPAKLPPSEGFEPQNDSSQGAAMLSFESESTKQSYEPESSREESSPAAMESEPEKRVPDLSEGSATDVGIEHSFANPIPEEMIAKLNDPTPEPSADDIFEKEAAAESAADSEGA